MGRRDPIDLEQDWPQGDPGAIFCRHCGTGRTRHGPDGVLFCGQCDGGSPP